MGGPPRPLGPTPLHTRSGPLILLTTPRPVPSHPQFPGRPRCPVGGSRTPRPHSRPPAPVAQMWTKCPARGRHPPPTAPPPGLSSRCPPPGQPRSRAAALLPPRLSPRCLWGGAGQLGNSCKAGAGWGVRMPPATAGNSPRAQEKVQGAGRARPGG